MASIQLYCWRKIYGAHFCIYSGTDGNQSGKDLWCPSIYILGINRDHSGKDLWCPIPALFFQAQMGNGVEPQIF
jgi:hypothetical protein